MSPTKKGKDERSWLDGLRTERAYISLKSGTKIIVLHEYQKVLKTKLIARVTHIIWMYPGKQFKPLDVHCHLNYGTKYSKLVALPSFYRDTNEDPVFERQIDDDWYLADAMGVKVAICIQNIEGKT